MIQRQTTIDKVGVWVIFCDRFPDGYVVNAEKDRRGFYWTELFHKERPHEEENFRAYHLADNLGDV